MAEVRFDYFLVKFVRKRLRFFRKKLEFFTTRIAKLSFPGSANVIKVAFCLADQNIIRDNKWATSKEHLSYANESSGYN